MAKLIVRLYFLSITGPSQLPIWANKSNYMNYSQFKKNEHSVLLYGNDSRGWNNYNFGTSSHNSFTENLKGSQSRQPQQLAQPVGRKRDFSQIFMEGRKMFHVPSLNKDERKGRSQPRWQWESGKLRRKIANWNHKIPFCLDARCDTDKIIAKAKVSNHAKRGKDLKLRQSNISLLPTSDLGLKLRESSKVASKIR